MALSDYNTRNEGEKPKKHKIGIEEEEVAPSLWLVGGHTHSHTQSRAP